MRRILPLVHRREKRREDIAPRGLIGGARFGQQKDQRTDFLVTENDEALMIDPTDDAGGCLLCS